MTKKTDNEYYNAVLQSLTDLQSRAASIDAKVDLLNSTIGKDLTELKIKYAVMEEKLRIMASMWGTMGGLVAAVVVVVVQHFMK